MRNHWRDRKFAKTTTITQALEDPRYRKLSSMEFQLSSRTHDPVFLIKPSKVTEKVISQIYQKIGYNQPGMTQQKTAMQHYLSNEEEYVDGCGLQSGGVEQFLAKFEAQSTKMWKSTASYFVSSNL